MLVRRKLCRLRRICEAATPEMSKFATKSGYAILVDAISEAVDESEQNSEFTDNVFSTLLFGYGCKDMSAIYVIIVIITLISPALAALLFWKTLRRSLFTVSDLKSIKALKILLLISVCVNVILLCVVNSIAKSCIKESLEGYIRVGLGVGPLLKPAGVIFIVVTVRAVSSNSVDQDYDNADVSYAPHVVGYQKHGK